MSDKKIIVGIIPARGGSKRLPKKNILPLAGKPVIAYTIEAALESGVFDRLIVSTDDLETAEIGKKYGAEVPFMRPTHLCTDTAHTPPVIEHAINFIEEKEGIKVDVAVSLEPTSPLRTAEHIRKGVKKFLESEFDSVISISKSFPPQWLFEVKGNKLKLFLTPEEGVNPLNLESQELKPTYQPNGVLYITNRKYLKERNSIISLDNCGYIITDDESSVDLDDELTLKLIEAILNKRKKKLK